MKSNSNRSDLGAVGIVLFLFLTFGTFACAGTYGGGKGDPNEPYQIWTAEQMNQIGSNPNDWNQNFRLMANIDLSNYSGTAFNIIGTLDNPFTGTFDGSGYVIQNFAYSTESQRYVGLFSCVHNAEIRGLGLENISISSAGSYLGGLAGYQQYGNIRDCYVTGSIVGVSDSNSVGGLVGRNSFGTIDNCHSEVVTSGESKVGGLVGNNFGGTISDSFSSGLIGGGNTLGGVVGYNESGKILKCYSTVEVSGTGNSIGGLVGENALQSMISDCHSSGPVSGNSIVGGLVGLNQGTISTSYSNGNISGDSSVGGLVGLNGGTISTSFSIGSVQGQTDVGGLVGNENGNPTITDCYSNSPVSGINSVGGLVGRAKGVIFHCYSTGTISGGDINIGGLIGGAWGNLQVSDCFWDTESTGQMTSAAGIGLTTDLMRQSLTYIGWNSCDNQIWTIDEGKDYPRLEWENRPGSLIPSFSFMGLLEGSGEVDDPFQIWTSEDLSLVGRYSCEWDKSFILMADIDFSGYTGLEFKQIGTDPSHPFTGIFNGNDHTLSHLTTTQYNDNAGIFGYVARPGQIRDLYIDNPTILTPQGYDTKGGLVGYNDGGTLSGCHITFLASNGGCMGGLVGINGGLGTISDCSSSGSLRGQGGLVGTNSGTIMNCQSSCSISGSGYSSSIGGLVGSNGGTITNCYASGSVSTNSGFSIVSSIGGLVGGNGGIISACWATGSVLSLYAEGVGGFAGYSGGTLIACYATGSVHGQSFVGGLVGRLGEGSVTNCFASGSVKGSNSVGGLIGRNGGWYCYKEGTVTASYATGDVTGYEDYREDAGIGGFVGFNCNGGMLTACYSTGRVTYIGEHPTTNIGGFAGEANQRDIVACFWDIERSGLSGSYGGKGLSAAQMKSLSVYRDANWAGKGWVINDGQDYPRLAWEGTEGIPIPEMGPIPLIGTGTTGDPYQIGTGEEIALLSGYASILDKNIVLMRDLDLSGIQINPIGDLGQFTGVFDGGGHVIYNMAMIMPENDYVGLFKYVGPNGSIRDLTLENVQVQGRTNVGGLVGYLNSGRITRCSVMGLIQATGTFVGALVGVNYEGEISNCQTHGFVQGLGGVGGLTGENNNWLGRIENCQSYSDVKGLAYSVGGVAGRNVGTITACCATGSVSGDGYVGGLVGDNLHGTIIRSYATGTVTGKSNVGGVAGYHGKTIQQCFASGTVIGTSYAGGLIGYNESGQASNSYSFSNVSGNLGIGGLVGYAYGLKMSNCYSTGHVSGSGNIGGVVGYLNTGGSQNCFWDIQTSGQSKAHGENFPIGATGKTTTQMKILSTFSSAGWDFVGESANGTADTWRMCVNNVDYPRLSWEFSQGGDFDCPNGVDLNDLLYLSARWLGTTPAKVGAADSTSDGKVDLSDFAILSENWPQNIP
jgi:hypothetical protein